MREDDSSERIPRFEAEERIDRHLAVLGIVSIVSVMAAVVLLRSC